MKRYRVKLSAEERQELKTLVSRGRAAAYKQTHGRVLLLSDEAHADGAMKDEDIARVLQIGRATVERVRRRCVKEGIEAALGRKQQVNRRPKRLDGQGEAHLIALACGEPPEGRIGHILVFPCVSRQMIRFAPAAETVPAAARVGMLLPGSGCRWPKRFKGPRCTKNLNLPKRGASPNGWRFTTLPSMGVGWIWPRLKSE